MSYCNTEEAFVLSNLKEFVKIWGSGGRAQFNLECKNGSAWIKLKVKVADPASPHYHPRHHEPAHKNRHKGPARRGKDRQRTAAHRAGLAQLSSASQSSPPARYT